MKRIAGFALFLVLAAAALLAQNPGGSYGPGAANAANLVGPGTISGPYTANSTMQGVSWIANQGSAFSTGSVGLASGWGTSTVTSASGFNQHFRFTISITGTISANPTVTVIESPALPTTATLCVLHHVGGNQPFISTIVQTTQSTTTPIFTITGTPTAGDTMTLEGICGP